jgi:NADH-quinone oxidoreductase subunit A
VSCIGQTLPYSGGRGAFNHVCSGLETIPNGTEAPFCPHRKRVPEVQATQAWTKAFRALPLIVRCAKPQSALSLERIQSGLGVLGSKPKPDRRRRVRERLCGRIEGLPDGRPEELLMNALLQEYLPLVIFIAVALGLGLALLIAPFLVAYKQPDPEKLSAYECGFNAFDDARMKFDVRFYLVAILFIIFDLEVTFLFPWAVVYGQLGVYGFWSMMVFLAVLTVGFIYEWKKGALEWD